MPSIEFSGPLYNEDYDIDEEKAQVTIHREAWSLLDRLDLEVAKEAQAVISVFDPKAAVADMIANSLFSVTHAAERSARPFTVITVPWAPIFEGKDVDYVCKEAPGRIGLPAFLHCMDLETWLLPVAGDTYQVLVTPNNYDPPETGSEDAASE